MEVLNKDVFEKNCNKVLIMRNLHEGTTNVLTLIDLNTVSRVHADINGVLKIYNKEGNIIYNNTYVNKEQAKQFYDKILSLLTCSKTE